jgi:predicted nucleic acid-binding protein
LRRIVVDTSLWSLALRRKHKDLSKAERVSVFVLQELIKGDRVILLGLVRQEVLSGIRDPEVFERLRQYLGDFDDETIGTADHEQAACCHNACMAGGVAASTVDMLICAVAQRLDAPIFTDDRDFRAYAAHVKLKLPTAEELQEELRRARESNEEE